MDNKDIYLKILSGPHLGAEVVLNPGEYLLGSSEDCDLVLHDGTVAAEHAKLVIATDKSAKIIPLATVHQKDGQPIPAEGQVVEPYQLMTVGTTSICLGVVGETWPEMQLPLWGLTKPEAKKEEKPVPEGQLPTEGAEGAAVPAELAQAEPDLKKAEEVLAAEEEQPPPKGRFWRQVGFATAAAVVVVTIGSAAYYLVRHWPESPIIAVWQPTHSDLIENILRHNNVSSQVTVRVENNVYEVSGYLANDRKVQQLQQDLWQFDPQIVVNLYSTEAIKSAVSDVLQGMGLALTIDIPEPGVVSIVGCIPELTHWQEAEDKIKQDVRGIKQLKGSVQTIAEVLQKIIKVANKAGIDTVQFEWQKKFLVAEGIVTKDMQPTWANVKEAIERDYGAYFHLQDRTATKSQGLARQSKIDFRIRLINVGAVRWIVLDDGKKYFEGARLPQGYILMAIESDGILLKNEQGLVRYRLDGVNS